MTKQDAEEAGPKEVSALLERLKEREKANASTKGWSEDRWLPAVREAHGKIEPNRIFFFFVRVGLVGGAASVPVFATAGTLTTGHAWGWVTVIVSLVLALLLALDAVYRPGIRWRSSYDDYHQLVNAGWAYLETEKDANTDAEAHKQFVTTVEGIIEQHRVESYETLQA